MKKVILVFDVGKTNKKLLLFNERYEVVHEEAVQFAETADDDGFLGENLEQLSFWLKDSFKRIVSDESYDVKAVNFSGYGASFVHLNNEYQSVTSIYNYLKPYPAQLLSQFYEANGGQQEFAIKAASPVLGSLNSGMQLYWLKHTKPTIFKQIAFSLHLPQYLSFLISGQCYSEITSIGCHTNLWNFQTNKYCTWLETEDITEKLPPIAQKNFVINSSGLKIGLGLHDSSAALIPYLASINEPFVLLSTGTWNISLNAFNDSPLTIEELEQDSLCYLTFEGKPVKASRLFAGHQHEEKIKAMAVEFNVPIDYFKTVRFDPQLIDSELSSYESAYHDFIGELIKKQVRSTDLILKNSSVQSLFVDGGFAKNEVFMKLLARAYPHLKVFTAQVAQASALGAALAIHSAWNEHDLPENLINAKVVN